MDLSDEIRNSKKKPKELTEWLALKIERDRNTLDDIQQCLKTGSTAEKGICMEAIEHVSKSRPRLVRNHIGMVIGHINSDAPKVKWESARVIGNLAFQFPEEVATVIPSLLENTRDKGTVVRWSAAYALSEIAKSNPGIRNTLLPEIRRIIKNEKNNGVKNVYLKALKAIEKQSSC